MNLVYLQHKRPAPIPVTDSSRVLFRLGEMCNYNCPMCPVSGLKERFYHDYENLIGKLDYLHELGVKALVVTGGEPTIHPNFEQFAQEIANRNMTWDINTNGHGFADEKLSAYCRSMNLQRAIVSLHSHLPEVSDIIFGSRSDEHQRTCRGISTLLSHGVEVMINCVLTKHNLETLGDFVTYLARNFSGITSLKIAFPNDMGIGKRWEGADIQLDSIVEPLKNAVQCAKENNLDLHFEGIPICIHEQTDKPNYGRSQFGETHYLDEINGRELKQITVLERNAAYFGTQCSRCIHEAGCSGITNQYLSQVGTNELKPYYD